MRFIYSLIIGLLLGTSTLSAQNPIPIMEARQLGTGNTVTVAGWVTVTDQFLGPMFIQDETAGIAVYSASLMRPDFNLDVQLGDSVVVTGSLSIFSGLLQISGNNVTVEIYPEGNREIIPQVITVSDLNTGNFESQLIQINNVEIPHRGFFQVNTSYSFSDNTGNGEIRVQRFNAEFDGAHVPTEQPIDIIGVAGRFNATRQLMPRFPSDFGIETPVYPGDDMPLDDTIDILTWNIEWFGDAQNAPGDLEVQFQNVKRIIETLQPDIIAMQEISSESQFQRLIDEMEGYDGYLANYTQTQRTAWFYRTARVNPLVLQVLEDGFTPFDWAGRRPLKMLATVNSRGQSRRIYMYNIHAKSAVGDAAESYQRRVRASIELKNYLDNNRAGEPIIVLGDYNDDIPQSTFQNNTSPYSNFDQDPNYHIITRSLSEQGFVSYGVGNFRSMIDHIMISDALMDVYFEGSERVLVPNFVDEYLRTTSDHFPVYVRFDMTGTFTNTEYSAAIPSGFALKGNFPNPFNPTTNIRFQLSEPNAVTVTVYDVLGRLVAQPKQNTSLAAGTHQVTFDATHLPSGMYVYTVHLSNGEAQSGKMMLIK